MLREIILEAVRWGRGSVMVRDLVHRLQDDRRREGEAWARRTDPMGLGMFSAGRKLLVQTAGPSRYKPHVVEREVLEELRRMAHAGAVRVEYGGSAFPVEHRQIPWDARVLLPVPKVDPVVGAEPECEPK